MRTGITFGGALVDVKSVSKDLALPTGELGPFAKARLMATAPWLGPLQGTGEEAAPGAWALSGGGAGQMPTCAFCLHENARNALLNILGDGHL
jgi:hypothetical protein